MELLQQMDSLLRTFWLIAIPSSLIFLVQTVMTFLGTDASDGLEADFDSNLDGADAPFQLFTLRNLIHFLLGFSWTGISFYSTLSNRFLLIGLAVVIGLLFVFLFFFILLQIRKLAEDNSFRIEKTLQQIGEVYVPVPAAKSGTGKVSISVHGSMHELDAMTEQEAIPTGTKVRVLRLEGNRILIVEKI